MMATVCCPELHFYVKGDRGLGDSRKPQAEFIEDTELLVLSSVSDYCRINLLVKILSMIVFIYFFCTLDSGIDVAPEINVAPPS